MHHQHKLFRTHSHRWCTSADRAPAIPPLPKRQITIRRRTQRHTTDRIRDPDRTRRAIVSAAPLPLLIGDESSLTNPHPDGLGPARRMPGITACDRKWRRHNRQRTTQPRGQRTDHNEHPLRIHSRNSTHQPTTRFTASVPYLPTHDKPHTLTDSPAHTT